MRKNKSTTYRRVSITLKSFIEDEKAQGSIEYILLAGGVIATAVITYVMYMRMTRSTVEALNRSVENVTQTMENMIQNDLPP